MDYYQLLRVRSSASKEEIEEAYQRLRKESRYDSTINMVAIDNAYRILTDTKHKAAYDTLVANKERSDTAYASTIARRKTPPKPWDTKRLAVFAGLLLVIAIGYYGFRFGHVFKQFSVGDTIYFDDTNQKLGTILKQEDHTFGSTTESAYLIQTDQGQRWFPVSETKIQCYKKDNKPKP